MTEQPIPSAAGSPASDRVIRAGTAHRIVAIGAAPMSAAIQAVRAALRQLPGSTDPTDPTGVVRELRAATTDRPSAYELGILPGGVMSRAELAERLRPLAAAHGVTLAACPVWQPGEPVLFVLDVDSTLIQDEVIELIAEHAGTRDQVAAVTEAAMRGELDFAASLRARVATLAGLPESVLDEVRAAIRLSPGAERLIRGAHGLGHRVGVVSGGFAQILDPLAKSLGLDHRHANTLEIAAGRLTGAVTGEIVDRAVKARTLREYAAADAIPVTRTVAIGDGANDLDMMAAAALGVAYRAKPIVRAQADTAIDAGLDDVLLLLGYTDAEVDAAIDAADARQAP